MSEPEAIPAAADGNAPSKKALKKEQAKAEKALKRQQHAAAAGSAAAEDSDDPLASSYGDVPLEDIQSKSVSGRTWTRVVALDAEFKDRTVIVRGNAQAVRAVGKKMVFLVVREEVFTVQCILTAKPEEVSAQMVRFAAGINRESIVDVEGVVSVPEKPITSTSQQVEIQVKKIYCVNRAVPNLPINIEDAARSEKEFEKAEQAGEQLVHVGQDTRLNHRVLDIRTPANQGIFRIQCQVENSSKRMGFTEAGSSRSLDQLESMSEKMDMDKLWKEIRCLGTSAMSWKERKKLEDKQVVNLGGKALKRQRLPLRVAKPMMKKQKKREQKQLEEGLLLGQFMKRSRGKKQDKRRAEDRVLMATEGHFKGGILNVKHLLKPNPPGSNEMPSARGMHQGRKKGKDKGRGKKKGKGRRH